MTHDRDHATQLTADEQRILIALTSELEHDDPALAAAPRAHHPAADTPPPALLGAALLSSSALICVATVLGGLPIGLSTAAALGLLATTATPLRRRRNALKR